MNNKPNALVLAALPAEFNLDKENIVEWTKANIDSLVERIKHQVDPQSNVDLDIRFASVGKVNIVYGFMDAIRDAEKNNKNIDYIINLGSAGSIDGNGFKIGDVVQCDYAMQTDLDLSGILDNTIGTNKNELNLSTDNSAFHSVEAKVIIDSSIYTKAICGSSDKFPIAYGQDWHNAQNTEGRSVAVLDQELGALAVAVKRENGKRINDNLGPISLISLKYVSNQITRAQLEGTQVCDESGSEWLEDLWKSSDCQEKLLKGLNFVIKEIVALENKRQVQ